MRRTRLLARLLLLILGLTFLSPHFGPEAMGTDIHHDGHSASLVLYGSLDGGEGHAISDHHDEHACAAHMLAHMPVQASSDQPAPLLKSRPVFPRPREQGFATRERESPDRPPRMRPA